MKTLKRSWVSLLALLALAVSSAHAAVPADVTTAITDAKTDALVIAAAVLVVIVGIYAFKLMRKAL